MVSKHSNDSLPLIIKYWGWGARGSTNPTSDSGKSARMGQGQPVTLRQVLNSPWAILGVIAESPDSRAHSSWPSLVDSHGVGGGGGEWGNRFGLSSDYC